MLPGLFNALFLASAAAIPVTSVSLISTTTSRGTTAGITIVMPTVQDGDVAMLFNNAVPGGTKVVPTGFTEIGVGASGKAASYKVCTAADSGTTLTGINSTDSQLLLFVLRGNAPITTVTIGDFGSESTAAVPAAQSVLSSGATPPVIAWGWQGTNGGSTITGPTVASSTIAGTVARQLDTMIVLSVKGTIMNSSPVDIAVSGTDHGTNWLASFYSSFA